MLVKEGKYFYENLKTIGQNEKWLENELNIQGIPLADVILMFQEDNSNIVTYTINEVEKNFD